MPTRETSRIFRALATEAGPLLAFFISFMVWGIFVATGVFMACMALAVAATVLRKRTLPTFPLLGTAMVLVLGGLTLVLDEATFIKVQPTAGNALFGLMILAGPLFGRNFLRQAFGDAVALSDAAWRALMLRSGVFLLSLALLNEGVRLNFSTETWVWFKVFVILPLDALFVASQWPLIRRERRNRSPAPSGQPAPQPRPAS